ncbi:MAG: SIR2 family protein [Candidatus Solibacter sp.]
MPISSVEPNIGNFSKRTILTGAGWTRNWGGRLGEELWQDLLGHRAVQNNDRLRELLLDERSFEAALGKVQGEPFTSDDRQAFKDALLEAFLSMDREIARPDHHPWINIYKVQDLLFRFWGLRGQSIDTGYMFTLNQDLWPERNLYNEHVSGAAGASLPGLLPQPSQRLFTTDLGRYSDRFLMQPVADPAAHGQLRGRFNVIKLHGSFNWRTADGRNELVVGTEKGGQIAASPLLSWYREIFRCVLSVGGGRLMIVGYGFGDEHVNAVIADAIERFDLKVFIWDTGPNLMDRVRAAPHGTAIWRGLISTATRPLIEVFPSNQAETEEYRRIRDTFFS